MDEGRNQLGASVFRTANSIARQFTFPVVLSRKSVGGQCASSIGSFVVVNDEGWIITAGHIIDQLSQLVGEEQQHAVYLSQHAAIVGDSSLGHEDRRRALKKLTKPDPNATDRASAWWGGLGTDLVDIQRLVGVDLAYGRLENFRADLVHQYPVFKDPAKDFEPGTSLCKLGFPFHQIVPSWDAQNQAFHLPPGALPIPFFPLDGIFTRILTVALVLPTGQAAPAPPFRLLNLETSSPGLRGQSGGPIFDVHGSIWALQSHTTHVPLGFEPKLKTADGKPFIGHQVINLGVGVASETIIGALSAYGVKHQVSTY